MTDGSGENAPAGLEADLCVIGAGAGGLSVAAGASQMGVRVVLIEKGEMGGDCLNTGCVPSKALLAVGHAALFAKRAKRFGVRVDGVKIDAAQAFEHVQGVVAAIRPHDSQERFEGLGVQVLRAGAQFVAPDVVEAGGVRIKAKYFVVATGSSPFVPPIDGLNALGPLTNETVFGLGAVPEHLIVLGGGPVGCELAQAFRGLGARVTILEMNRILSMDDPEMAEVVRTRLLEDGIVLHEETQVLAVKGSAKAPKVVVKSLDGKEHTVQGSHILVAAGRRANVQDLGLEKAGVDFSPQGIEVDRRLRSVSNRRVFAIGDVAAPDGKAGPKFTHAAGHHAGVVIRNALFKWPAKVNHDHLPHVTYTDPELAHVGMTEAQARERFPNGGVKALEERFKDNDRALAEGRAEGRIKIVVGRRGRILGCTIAGPDAGNLIAPWVLAMENGLKLSKMAGTVLPYPTLGEISKRAAGSYFTPALYAPRTKAIVRFLLKVFS